ncbi:SDR family oxidoreductase [Polymorphobacter sp.]|uniref:SDR family oxidoreductase n=1 Tax=Polymorphobacter sp. TaxID=1909290 RepID=UPI003F71B20F
MPQTLLVIGASSDIGRAAALRFAAAGWSLILAGRDEAGLAREAADIIARHQVSVATHRLDILDTPDFNGFLAALTTLPDAVVSVVGLLGDVAVSATDPEDAAKVMRSNYEGPAILLGALGEQMRARGSGTIIGISSVAGDRGRGSNYVYGSAKAGFTAFLSGLRNRLAKHGVRVVTIKPGFVRTRMTASMKLPPLVTAEADEVGKAVYEAAMGQGADSRYVRRIWWPIMTIIKAIPEPLFKRLSL